MNEADRSDFMELLGDLYGAHGQNLKGRIAGGYWRGLAHMTLGEFRSAVTVSLERLQFSERGVALPPTVSQLWDNVRDQRQANTPGASSSEAAPARFAGDHWSVAGNLLLLRHITRADKSVDLDYAPDSHGRPVVVGPHTEAIAKILTRWMNAWVTEVRESEQEARELDREKLWHECMADADRQAREYLERYVRRQEAA